MQEVTIKRDDSISLEKDIKQFLNPKFVFLPIESGFQLKVSDGDYVYKHDIVAMSKEGYILKSPISGKVLGLKKMDYYSESSVISIVIENDFKENVRSKRSLKKVILDYSKDEFLQILRENSYRYRKERLFDKYLVTNSILIINGVERDPNFANKRFLLDTSLEDVLEMSDFLGSVMDAQKIYFVIKNTDSEMIGKLTNHLGTYPNIELRLIPDVYPNGDARVLKKLLKIEGATTIEVEEVLYLYHILKRQKPLTSKLLTITGKGVSPNAVVRVKLGTLLSEVFVHNFDFTCKDVDVYVNGFLYGTKVDSLKLVIDDEIDGIYVTKKSASMPEKCLNCGLCSKTCPMGLNPKYVFDHDGKVKSEYYDTCIQCGLCDYVCPTNQNLKEKMKGFKES